MKFVRLLIPTILILIICVISYNAYNKAKTVSNKPLSVIPNFRITNKGLVDVNTMKIVPLIEKI